LNPTEKYPYNNDQSNFVDDLEFILNFISLEKHAHESQWENEIDDEKAHNICSFENEVRSFMFFLIKT
jgi:hypothetical protein